MTQIFSTLSHGLSLLAALAFSLLAGFYAALMSSEAVDALSAGLLFLAVALACLAVLMFVRRQLAWPARLALATGLVVACYALLPQSACATEPSAVETEGC